MKKNKLRIVVQLFVAITMVTVYGCKKTDNTTPDPVVNTSAVSIAMDAARGQYLVDKNNQTLYYFSDDYDGKNSCSGSCKAYWPYFYAGDLTQADLGAGLKLADFDTITVSGTKQTRYKGWPLYYYAPAGTTLEPAGQITGESIANWLVAKPDYSIMLANGQMVGGDGKDYLSTYVEGTGKTVYFTDAKGLTLYIFTPDSFNINKYTKPDFSNDGYWPIYDSTMMSVPSSLDKTLFSSINVFGKHQITYKGWPLYYFGGDSKKQGNTKGITVPTPGSLWPVAVKDLSEAPH